MNTKPDTKNRVLVYCEIAGQIHLSGQLYINIRRGQLSSTFSYQPDYLTLPDSYPLEPSLPLQSGIWATGAPLPGALSDAAPDRWGRNLILKRIRATQVTNATTNAEQTGGARALSGASRQVTELDYLLGVSDITRQGALRFKTELNGVFQHPHHEVPKLISLPQLLNAANQVARADWSSDPASESAAIKTLLDAGTASLGGARPKASVSDGHDLFIAKFPHHHDEWNVMAWEKTVLDIAAKAGLNVPKNRLVLVENQPVLLLQRFDREGSNRIGYISALTLLGLQDGQRSDYFEIAELLPEYGANVCVDLLELWARIVFSVVINNTDDHLRNHGFLRQKIGWVLAPLFDINPNPDLGASRVTSIDAANGAIEELVALKSFASVFGLDESATKKIAGKIAIALDSWKTVAHKNGITAREIDIFEAVFNQGKTLLKGVFLS